MRTAFGWTLEQYLYFRGYPHAAPLVGDPARWLRYIADSLIETSIGGDGISVEEFLNRPVSEWLAN